LKNKSVLLCVRHHIFKKIFSWLHVELFEAKIEQSHRLKRLYSQQITILQGFGRKETEF